MTGALETSQSWKSCETSWKCFWKAPVLASRITIELAYKFSPCRGALAKSGAGLPPGTYKSPLTGSSEYEVQVAPPVMGVPAAFFHVPAFGAPPGACGPRAASPDAFGTM